ncbi:succinate dehydrogenase, hydrophobic membrane anchor protein [Solirhodobacter olei]|uniref:succinate dehydrogenase, hydrophobic membrane anchor protein n=1 Tax=Solirhodobacter olei TaxID=2493082 RepID=UPI000FDA2B85|nr:succinate dehydrogenase, hydrophobic membrane anchor protein [Solirhodobacter olei]
MQYLTDRKRATGLGAAHTGTHHHWSMQVSAVALVILVPLFIFTFGHILGHSYAEVTAYYARPFPAIVAGLTVITALHHLKMGAQMMIEDYWHGVTRKALIIAVTCITYAAMATGILALVRLALSHGA